MKYTAILALSLISMPLFANNIHLENRPDNINSDEQKSTKEKAIIFTAQSGETVNAFEGIINVPENRENEDSRIIALHYIRFPSTSKTAAKQSPIIYLAGGPGGSGINTAKFNRFPLFMAMREFGDVIAFDQRGTGKSNDLANCKSSQKLSIIQPTSNAEYFQKSRLGFKECLAFWKDQNIDVYGYNSRQSVADLNDLRQSLGADKISLWGISYGSHLSLAALKDMDQYLDKVVMTATEGLDQTIKQPKRADLYFDRLQQAINTQAEAKAKYPDIKSLITRVLQRLEKEPLELMIPVPDGKPIEFLLQKRDMQQYTSALVADPNRAALILSMYKSIDEGNNQPIVQLLSSVVSSGDDNINFRTMSMLMDVASGSGDSRRKMINEQAKSSILGLHMNATMHLETVDPSLDLGNQFRIAPASNVPTLVLSGTLDGRTYPQSHREATAGLTQRQFVNVKYGGHNLFMSSPKVTETIQNFMRGNNVDGEEIIIDLPKF